MKIRNKILLLFSLIILLFSIFLILYRYSNRQQVEKIINNKKLEQEQVLNKFLKLKSETYINIVNEYSRSKTLYELISNNPPQASLSYKPEILSEYDLSSILIYDNNRNPLFINTYSNLTKKTILPENLFGYLLENKKCHFYILGHNGLTEIFGSLIRPDDKSLTINSPYGFCIASKIWDKNYLNEIEQLLNGQILIQNASDNSYKSKDISVITASKTLTDINGKTIAKLVFSRQSPVINKIISYNYFMQLFIGLFIIITLLVIIISLQRYVIIPLNKIEKSLISEESELIKPYSKQRDEIGKISSAIREFLKQKELILQEIKEKNLIEKDLKESEMKFKNLLNNVSNGIFRSTIDGRFVFVNRAMAEICGYESEDEMLKLNIAKDIYAFPEHRKYFLSRLNDEKKLRNVELNIKRKDGKILTCLFNGDLVYDINGKRNYIVSLIDISKYKYLKANLNKLQLAVSQSNDGILIVNNDLITEYANYAFAEMHGYNPQELTGKHISMLYANLEYESDSAIIISALNNTGSFSGEIKHNRKDGSSLTMFASISIIKDFNDNIIGNVGVYKDLTEIKKAEDEIKRLNNELEKKIFTQNQKLCDANIKLQKTISDLEEKEKEINKNRDLYFTTINSSNELINVVNNELEIILVNEPCLEWHKKMGLKTDIIGKKITEVYSTIKPNISDEYIYVIKNGKEIITEEYIRHNGVLYIIETSKVPVIEKGQTTGIITIMRDITYKKETEKKILSAVLEAEEKEKKRFSEDLHDGLGALLSTMKIYLNSILKKQTIEESYDLLFELKNMIYEAVENTRGIAYNMTPNILVDYGLVKAVKSYCEKIKVNQNLNIEFNSNGFNERLNHIVEINIFRILQELINNSLKHSDAKKINISMGHEDNNLKIVYQDNGKGFDKEKYFNNKLQGIGINNIFARIKLLDGTCNFDCNEGKGIHIEISIDTKQFKL